jgi:hypothetical protein
MTPSHRALLAVAAARAGQTEAARDHLTGAGRPACRRDRQILEIATLVVAGERERAAGLALEHLAAFPDDEAVVARMGP